MVKRTVFSSFLIIFFSCTVCGMENDILDSKDSKKKELWNDLKTKDPLLHKFGQDYNMTLDQVVMCGKLERTLDFDQLFNEQQMKIKLKDPEQFRIMKLQILKWHLDEDC